jgi:hypothetical protein
MMAVAGIIAVTATGIIVLVGYIAVQGMVLVLEIASKIVEEMR